MHTHFLFVRFALALVFAPVCRCRLATARDSRVFLISNTGRAITDLLVHLRSLAFRSLVEFLKAVHTDYGWEGDVVELSSLTLVQERKRILFTTFVAIRSVLYLSPCFRASCSIRMRNKKRRQIFRQRVEDRGHPCLGRKQSIRHRVSIALLLLSLALSLFHTRDYSQRR